MFEKIKHPSDRKRVSRFKTNGGVKALISCGDLGSVIAAAKQWYKVRTERGEDASKLLHHIANAEAVYIKYNKRNAQAFAVREERRMAESQAHGGVKFSRDARQTVEAQLNEHNNRPTRW